MTSTINFSTSYGNKGTGANQSNTLTAEEWNGLMSDLNTMVGEIPTSSGSSNSVVSTEVEDTTATDPTVNVSIASGVTAIGTPNVIQLTKKKKGVNTTIVSGNNINIEPRESVGETKGGNIALKPGDDIELWSHHRLADNQNEVSVKVLNGDEKPTKLQLNAAEMTITTKKKVGDDANVFDINVNSDTDTKGYLKVRAQAIDLRCETPGGIALQPKGNDGDGHENKIKFEHNGGDGKEFGTFNTEHTSIFTNDYRFNKDGVVYAVKRGALETTYKVDGDPTSGVKKVDYPTQSDDFKDIINENTPHCTWEDVVNTANLITTYELDDQNNIIDGGVLKVKGINNNTTNTLRITTADPSNGTVQDYVIPQHQTIVNPYTPQTIASCSINDIIMFVNWAKGTGFGPWSSEAIANKEEMWWNGSEFTAATPVTPNENPIVG